METVKEYLIDARDRIADPKNHCQGYAVINASGEPCGYDDEAVQWCLFGTMRQTQHHNSEVDFSLFDEGRDLIVRSVYELGYSSRVEANDIGGHSVVMKVFDIAIERAEG